VEYPLFSKLIDLKEKVVANGDAPNLKIISQKFGLISKEEIDKLPQIA
jgi:hypothetical protein